MKLGIPKLTESFKPQKFTLRSLTSLLHPLSCLNSGMFTSKREALSASPFISTSISIILMCMSSKLPYTPSLVYLKGASFRNILKLTVQWGFGFLRLPCTESYLSYGMRYLILETVKAPGRYLIFFFLSIWFFHLNYDRSDWSTDWGIDKTDHQDEIFVNFSKVKRTIYQLLFTSPKNSDPSYGRSKDCAYVNNILRCWLASYMKKAYK